VRSFGVIVLLFALLTLAICGKLFWIDVIKGAEFSTQAEDTRTSEYTLHAKRGTIYDRNGVVLAASVDATTIYCNPKEVRDAWAEAQALADVLEEDAAYYYDKLTTADTTYVYVQRQGSTEDGAAVAELALSGVYCVADTRREYPNGSIGGQVIGVCNIDGEGISGLELEYNDVLSGTDGAYKVERGEDGTPIPGAVNETVAAVDGEDIMVSIDINMQDVMEQALAAGAEEYETDQGSSILMDGDTGEIYAICSYPYLDPTNLADSKVGSDNVIAITQAVEPGSMFKSVSALAVLEADAMTPDDELYAPSYITADGYEISDSHDREGTTMTLAEILSKSSNVGISLAVQKIGFEALYDEIEKLGFTELTGVDFPGEQLGYLPSLDTWSSVTGYNISFGQGISVTPLQMVRFYALVANGGTQVTPHFLIAKPQTGEYAQYESTQIIDDQDALSDLRSMLKGVVDSGTGKNAQVDGYDVCGKTSTAEIAENGKYKAGVYNLCFTGFIDNSSSNLVCYVGLNNVASEGNVASVFHDIMTNAIEQYKIYSD
jgi:cell division protein FtsI (penicillin-binding protein 3)